MEWLELNLTYISSRWCTWVYIYWPSKDKQNKGKNLHSPLNSKDYRMRQKMIEFDSKIRQ